MVGWHKGFKVNWHQTTVWSWTSAALTELRYGFVPKVKIFNRTFGILMTMFHLKSLLHFCPFTIRGHERSIRWESSHILVVKITYILYSVVAIFSHFRGLYRNLYFWKNTSNDPNLPVLIQTHLRIIIIICWVPQVCCIIALVAFV